jgi:nitrite reductase/ring-hydroxylating ferredoxin subunit
MEWENSMPELLVCRDGEVAEGGVRSARSGRTEIGAIRHAGKYYACRNLCPHQGGPACEGLRMPQIIELIDGDGVFHGKRYDENDMRNILGDNARRLFNLTPRLLRDQARPPRRPRPWPAADGITLGKASPDLILGSALFCSQKRFTRSRMRSRKNSCALSKNCGQAPNTTRSPPTITAFGYQQGPDQL